MAFPGHARSFTLSQSRDSLGETATELPKKHSQTGSISSDVFGSPLDDKQQRHLHYNVDSKQEVQTGCQELFDDKGNPPTRSLWIGNIPYGLSLSSLKRAFDRYGSIDQASMPSKQRYAFVNFTTVEAAIHAWRENSDCDIFQSNLINHIRFAGTQLETRQAKEHHANLNGLSGESSDSAKRDGSVLNQQRTEKTVQWPNGPPPAGPKSQRKDISPPPLRRSDSYRPRRASRISDRTPETERRLSSRDDDKRGHDVYRPSYRNDPGTSDRTHRKESISELAFKTPSVIMDDGRSEEPERISRPVHECVTSSHGSDEQPSCVSQGKRDILAPPDPAVQTSEPVSDVASASNVQLLGHERDQCHSASDFPNKCPDMANTTTITGIAPILSCSDSAQDVLSDNFLPPEGPHSEVDYTGSSLLSVTRFRSPLQRLRSQVDDTSSVISDRTSSSIASSRRKKCADCKKPESSLAALIACSTCPRRFHSTCGNPRPSLLSISNFVCGRCLKKQKTDVQKAVEISGATANKKTSHFIRALEALEEPYSPKELHDEIITDRITDDENPSTVMASIVPVLTDIPCENSITKCSRASIENELTSTPQEKQSTHVSAKKVQTTSANTHEVPGDQQSVSSICCEQAERTRQAYKTVTCPWWQKDNTHGCSVTESECMFAHQSTGIVSPNGFVKAKDWTCRNWYSTGACPKSEQNCKYAHRDTGLYVGIDGKASKKHMTCYYWKTQGQCSKPESKCIYAHTDTGIYVSDPCKAAQTFVRHSASSSMSSHSAVLAKTSDTTLNSVNILKSLGNLTTNFRNCHLPSLTFTPKPPVYDAGTVHMMMQDHSEPENSLADSTLYDIHGIGVEKHLLGDDITPPPFASHVSRASEVLKFGLKTMEEKTKASTDNQKPLQDQESFRSGSNRKRDDDPEISVMSEADGFSHHQASESHFSKTPTHSIQFFSKQNKTIQDPRRLKRCPSTSLRESNEINFEDEEEEDDYEPPEPISWSTTEKDSNLSLGKTSQKDTLLQATQITSDSMQISLHAKAESHHMDSGIEQPPDPTTASTAPSLGAGRNKCKVCTKTLFSGDLCVACRRATEPNNDISGRATSSNVRKSSIALAARDTSSPEIMMFEEDGNKSHSNDTLGESMPLVKHIKRKKSQDAMFASNKRPKPNPQTSYKSAKQRRVDVKSRMLIEESTQQSKEKRDKTQAEPISTSSKQLDVEEGISPSGESNKENRLPPQSTTDSENAISAEFEQANSHADHERSSSEEPLAQASLRRKTATQAVIRPDDAHELETTMVTAKSPTDNEPSEHFIYLRNSSFESASEDETQSMWHTPESRLGVSAGLPFLEYSACSDCSRRHVRCVHKVPNSPAVCSLETVRPKPACKDCNRRHKKCLHDIKGNFDEQTCYFWLKDLSKKGKKTTINERGREERATIERAAERYRRKMESRRHEKMRFASISENTDDDVAYGESEEQFHGGDDAEDELEQQSDEKQVDESEQEEDCNTGDDDEESVRAQDENEEIAGGKVLSIDNIHRSFSRNSSTSYFDSETDELALPEPRKISVHGKFNRNLGSHQQGSMPPLPRPANNLKIAQEHPWQNVFRQNKRLEWTEADEEAAILRLKQKGARFESDNDINEFCNEPIPQLGQPVRCPSPPELLIDPLRPKCKASNDFYRIFPEEHPKIRNRPPIFQLRITKGQGLKHPKLVMQRKLHYSRQLFGNAHWEVERKLPERLVETLVERNVRPKENDNFAPDLVEETKEQISFREFLGLPKDIEACLIGQGRGATLAFREAPSKLERDLGVFARKRRVGDAEKWPVQDR